MAKQDIEVTVYTSTESILSGNTRQYKPIDSAVERTLEKMPGLAVQNFSPNKKHLRRQKKDCQWWWRLHCQLDREIVWLHRRLAWFWILLTAVPILLLTWIFVLIWSTLELIANELGFPQNSIRTALADEIEWLLNGGLIIRHLPYFRKLKIDCL